MKIFYTDTYRVDLPDGHRFPMEKYRLVRQELIERSVLDEQDLFQAEIPPKDTLLLAHTARYVDAVCSGTLSKNEVRKIGFPWSQSLVIRSLASVGGTVCAAEEALENGVSGCLAGGTHHAFADSGEGYCVFNDIAVAITYLFKKEAIRRAAIIDLDVHQGNGNSSILGDREDVFIFSMHGEKNYPFQKVPSTIDIGLDDNTGDEEYLRLLSTTLPKVLDFQPDIVFYQAGVDPLKEDLLGRLALSKEGLAQRDRIVISECKKRSIPISLSLGGGYAKPIHLTVKSHVETYKVVKEVF